jgi:putative membrane protein
MVVVGQGGTGRVEFPVTSSAVRRGPFLLLSLTAAAVILSGIKPYDRLTWFLEVLPVLVGGPILVLTYRTFPLTSLAYGLVFVHALILIVGAHFTYSRVPLGFWLQDLLDLSRNHYDRLGHLAQGFVPAILVREILLRRSVLAPGAWLFFIVVCICLAISAFYELCEWWTATLVGHAADEFLATQGDIWDTQWDMLWALIGAVSAQVLLSGWHDRELQALRIG